MELGYLADAEDRFEQLLVADTGVPDDGIVTSCLGATHLLQGRTEGVGELVPTQAIEPTALPSDSAPGPDAPGWRGADREAEAATSGTPAR